MNNCGYLGNKLDTVSTNLLVQLLTEKLLGKVNRLRVIQWSVKLPHYGPLEIRGFYRKKNHADEGFHNSLRYEKLSQSLNPLLIVHWLFSSSSTDFCCWYQAIGYWIKLHQMK